MRVRNLVGLVAIVALTIGCAQAPPTEVNHNFRFKVISDSSQVHFSYTDCEQRPEFTCIGLNPAITSDKETIESTVVELRKWFAKRNRGIADWYVFRTIDNPEGIRGIVVETFQLTSNK
ncbi:MAG: hypothetical protein A2655_00115 [Candidatus Yanofskybacteria bacterium RIFCSPHIGHO2_01_FULL_43_42]|uniref:Uncharacterized protein n=1 Tax=Candidatus Yanofskybacteria bacterium RIFCSPLOWO2_01_FULL_43_22 TaxID=1802695 RepID=A0A1F8GF66_9BACT|nr:MAG: hypothetical protein A2655_00115 [Candidatus Yanofskybacteria bacterium RIFCSPHIGHO2_01_FULL_43_42]OGN12553.1 MAG: hypothetical protein A3D48_04450 [Candidatus Yanofskybacteria bacterium RIFCSPHIGHO2_02_FULL_43_17]OGN23700.1 MAG: hypothetical protein A3A13_00110 [Candidatus Yanofskybacteria bacterium RIFCSPLOWO2_01_FULL_43_22]